MVIIDSDICLLSLIFPSRLSYLTSCYWNSPAHIWVLAKGMLNWDIFMRFTVTSVDSCLSTILD